MKKNISEKMKSRNNNKSRILKMNRSDWKTIPCIKSNKSIEASGLIATIRTFLIIFK